MFQVSIVWLALWVNTSANSDGWHVCRSVIGKPQSCLATAYTGNLIAQHRGLYRSCWATIGQLTHCAHPFTGFLPLWWDGRFRECKVNQGRIVQCVATGFTGFVVAQTL